MLRLVWRAGLVGLAIVGLGAVLGGLWFLSGGISARVAPGTVEAGVARRLRSLAIPRASRTRASPVPTTTEAIAAGRRHFADHCAVCHANNGSGDVAMGRGLSPRAPDMRLAATQSLSDGELFFIIENGIRLTGMPAWGTGSAEGEEASWKLVQFIRRLPAITDAEVAEMEALNPRGPEEPEDPEAFLKGLDAPAAPKARHKH